MKEKKKRFDFKGLLKNFVSGSQEDLTEEEAILSDDSLTEKEKQELIAGLSATETLAHKLFADSLKVSNNLNLYKNSKVKEEKIKIDANAYKNNKNVEKDRLDD